MKIAGATAVEETYPFGIGQRTKQELFRQGKLQEIEEQNESIEKVTSESSVLEGKCFYNDSYETFFSTYCKIDLF